ncbi:lipase family protein [Gordonia amicalis]|uniref:Lipase family protein n=1 Tax=Gordonia amicalis TaxID=89053 RepID=A0ABU4DJC2_9ACTN|nr:lipase family protein [Gordonia amicalis]MDV6309847.1 lipase family protein [Gordonia amicalis]MDV7100331.1 lipase family protein [Gordonia amicalis]
MNTHGISSTLRSASIARTVALAAALTMGLTTFGVAAEAVAEPTTTTPSTSTATPDAADEETGAPADDNAGTIDVRGPGQAPGAVYANRDLARARMVAGAASGNDFTYWSTGADGKAHLSSGVLMVPAGRAPAGGWPVVAWAHGSRGIADKCAPSERPIKDDTTELSRWLGRGYAVASTDYAGVGTPGTPQYYDLEATARNIVDAVSASRDVSDNLSRSWAVVGEGQGAAAAITLARIAPQLQQRNSLNFKGAAATSIPAEFGALLANLGPSSASIPSGLAADALYTLSAIRNARPGLDVDVLLTDTGKKWMAKAANECITEFRKDVDGLAMGSLFAKPVSGNTELTNLLTEATALPSRGFVKPVIMTQSLQDTSVVVPLSLKYLNEARADRLVQARTYLTLDGAQSAKLSDNDIRAFIAKILR